MRAGLLTALAAAGLLAGGAAFAEDAPAAKSPVVSFELNKLEPAEGACRTYFVVENLGETEVTDLLLDVYLFDKQGIILRRAALAPRAVPPGKQRVVPFELKDVACDKIGKFHLDGVLKCKLGTGAEDACIDQVAVTSRAEGVPFEE